MASKLPQNRIKSSSKVDSQQKPLTKRDLMNKILNNQIQVVHSLQDQILNKKVLKCYVHGSQRKIEPSAQSNTKILNYHPQRLLQNNNQPIALGIEAPSIVGRKNVMFIKSQKSLTRQRSTSAIEINLANLRSCCHSRGTVHIPRSNTLPVRNLFQLKQNSPRISGGKVMTSILIPWNSIRDEPMEESTIFARSRMYQTTTNFRIKKNDLN